MTISLVVTGMGKERIAELAKAAGEGEVEATIRTDFEAALAVQNGDADFYIGACQSGAGGALGVANAILGSSKVVRMASVKNGDEAQAIAAALAEGKNAFGLTRSQVDSVVPVLVKAMVEARRG
jgi:dihydrodipicolinate synthase/N-acetylneuraminate lyase